MGKISKSIEIQSSSEKIFAFLLDGERMNEPHGGFVERKRTSNGPFGVGSTMHNKFEDVTAVDNYLSRSKSVSSLGCWDKRCLEDQSDEDSLRAHHKYESLEENCGIMLYRME